jgi:hypothetical protein
MHRWSPSPPDAPNVFDGASQLVSIIFAADLFKVFVFLVVAALMGYALGGGGKALFYPILKVNDPGGKSRHNEIL